MLGPNLGQGRIRGTLATAMLMHRLLPAFFGVSLRRFPGRFGFSKIRESGVMAHGGAGDQMMFLIVQNNIFVAGVES